MCCDRRAGLRLYGEVGPLRMVLCEQADGLATYEVKAGCIRVLRQGRSQNASVPSYDRVDATAKSLALYCISRVATEQASLEEGGPELRVAPAFS